ncbi:MAG: heparinase II/III domain-containing protein, partial [Myxococcota bacterium]
AELLEAWGSFRAGRRGRAAVRGRGAAGGFEWLHAGHDAWRFLPGRPRHERLFAVSEGVLLVLDAVLGSGHHRIRSALHLHPELPASLGLQVLARGGRVARASAPLHERFGETREMSEVALEADAELPWVGGFALSFGTHATGDFELRSQPGLVVARAGGFEIRWQLAADGALERVAVLDLETTPAG